MNHPDPVPGMNRQPYFRKGSETDPAIVMATVGDDGRIEFSPQGGGPVYRAPENEFLAEFDPMPAERYVELMKLNMPGFATGDWFEDGQEPIPAWFTAELWNGWACPAFEKEHMDAAIADDRIANHIYVPSLDAYLYVDTLGEPMPEHDFVAEAEAMDGDYKVLKIGGDEIEVVLERPRMIQTPNGEVKAYTAGAGGWCWVREDEPEATPTPRGP